MEEMEQIDSGVLTTWLQGVVWRKSRYSNPSGDCVELAKLPDGGIAVRNSRDRGGPVLTYTHAEFDAFMHGVKKGDFDDFID
jgi:uncharacterized protein DUF397